MVGNLIPFEVIMAAIASKDPQSIFKEMEKRLKNFAPAVENTTSDKNTSESASTVNMRRRGGGKKNGDSDKR
jgi:hypothetical protein